MNFMEMLNEISKMDDVEQLDKVVKAVENARHRIGQNKQLMMRVGDFVHLAADQKDHYRLGTGKITKLNPSRAKALFRDGKIWSCPYDMLELGEHPDVPWNEPEPAKPVKKLFGSTAFTAPDLP